MERKQKIIFGVLIGIVIILTIIFVFILISNKPKKDDTNTGDQKVIKEISQPTTEEQNEMSDIVNNARGFVETYFSYSNISAFSNAKEVYSFMTNNFKDKVDKSIAKAEESNKDNSTYFLKTTSVLNTNIKGDYKKNRAIVEVSVVEKNINSKNKEDILEKKYMVYMIKSDKWRIDDIKLVVLNMEKSIFN